MARRRYISTTTSTDKTVNTLATQYGDFALALYLLMIPHAEDDGTLTGEPLELLAVVMPMRRDKDESDVAAALEAMVSLGLIEWDEKRSIVLFPATSFYRYQTYIKPINRRPVTAQTTEEQGRSLQDSEERRKTPQNAASLPLPPSLPHPPPHPAHEGADAVTQTVVGNGGYLPPLAQDLEGFTDDPWAPARKSNPPQSRNETQAQSASAEGLKVCGAAAAKVDPRQQEIEVFLAEYPHCREILESRRGDARTSVVGFFLAIVQGWIADPDSIPAKPVPVPRKRTPEELKAIRAQRDKEASDEFWTRQEEQTGKPRAELIAEADRTRRDRANGGSDNFGWLDKLAPKSVATGMAN